MEIGFSPNIIVYESSSRTDEIKSWRFFWNKKIISKEIGEEIGRSRSSLRKRERLSCLQNLQQSMPIQVKVQFVTFSHTKGKVDFWCKYSLFHIEISGKISQNTFLTRQFCRVRKVFWFIFPEIEIQTGTKVYTPYY